MLIEILKYLFFFIICAVLQLMVLDNVYLFGYLNPNLLIAFYLALPIAINRFLYLLLGFAIGILIDVLYGTGGVNTSAYLMIGFVRNNILNLVLTQKRSEIPMMRLAYVEVGKIISFYSISFYVFFLVLFFVEDFTFYNFGKTFIKATISTIFNVFVLAVAEFLLNNKKPQTFNA